MSHNWTNILAPERPNVEVRPEVELVVRGFLSGLFGPLSTTELVDVLFPAKQAKAAPDPKLAWDARARLFKTLAALAENQMADCVIKGPPVKVARFGKAVEIRRLQWHAPDPEFVRVCKTCNRPL